MSSSNLGEKRVMTQQPNVPHFVRVIIQSDHLLQGKLAIPRKFMREYGSALSESVVLKVPSGMVWKVELIKSGDEILFGKGWDKFVQRNGIEHGYFLVFRYQESCRFRVIIFDLSATEIAYPCNSVDNAVEGDHKKKSKIEERNVNEEEDAHTERVGEFLRGLTKKHSVPTRCIKPQKRENNTVKTNIKEEEEDIEPEFVNEAPRSLKKKFRVSMPHFLPEKRMKNKAEVDHKLPTAKAEDQEGEECLPDKFKKRNGRKKKVTRKEKEDALSRARAAFKSANHYFMVVLQPAYIQRCYLPIPSSFHKLLREKGFVHATLSSLSGRTWIVRCHHNEMYTRITSGWNEFVKDNVLKVGDVCAFELIEGTKASFKVVFFRAAEYAKLSSKQGDRYQDS